MIGRVGAVRAVCYAWPSPEFGVREVSCRPVAAALAVFDRRGIPRERLVEGFAVRLDYLERPSNRIDWDVFADLSARLEAMLGVDALVEIGMCSPVIPAMRPLVSVIGGLTHPLTVYRVCIAVGGPSMFHNVRMGLEVLGPGHVRASVAIPPEYRDVPQLYHMFRGGLIANPTLCGQPPADVQLEVRPRSAVYDIRFQTARVPWLVALRSWVSRLLGTPGALAEIEDQRAELAVSYAALRESHRRNARQRRQLRQARERLQQTEGERSDAEARFHRAQKLEGIGLLAAGIAHDFNNLLASIVGNTELAIGELAVDAPQRRRLEMIRLGADRAADLTGQLLAYAGRRPTTTRDVDLGQLVSEIRDLMRTAVPRGTALHERLTADLPPVRCDPSQVQQVVMNLLTNAAAAVQHGGEITLVTGVVTVSAPRIAKAWVASTAAPGPHVYLEVIDTGAGMAPDTLARIFEPFFTTRADGRGLGLAAVLGIVRGHQGLIEVESARGSGSTFRVLLPAQIPAAAAPSPGATECSNAVGTVLVVDDEPMVLEVTGGLLQSLGFVVHLAAGGAEALGLAARHGTSIDAYLVDRRMPGLTGEEVFRALRAARPDARVVLYSGNLEDEVARGLLAEGLRGVLRKPFGRAELAAVMERVLA